MSSYVDTSSDPSNDHSLLGDRHDSPTRAFCIAEQSSERHSSTTSGATSPGHTNHGLLEIPDPSNLAEPHRQRQQSRPGPDVTTGEGVFHHASSSNRRDFPLDDLNIYYQNVGGMNSNVLDYHLASADCCYDIIALTETWLTDNTSSHQIFDSTYEVFRCDRGPDNSSKTIGGGVLLAVRKGLKARLIKEAHWNRVEQLWAAIELEDRTLFFCVIYIPPDRTRDLSLLETHTQSVSSIASRADVRDDMLIIGDFNMPGISWRQSVNGFLYPDPDRSVLQRGVTHILDSYSTATLKQICSVNNENHRCLDLCFVNTRDVAPWISPAPVPLVKDVPHHRPLHLILERKGVIDTHRAPAPVKYDFRRADYRSMSVLLSTID